MCPGRYRRERPALTENPDRVLAGDLCRIVKCPLFTQTCREGGKPQRADIDEKLLPFEFRLEEVFPTVGDFVVWNQVSVVSDSVDRATHTHDRAMLRINHRRGYRQHFMRGHSHEIEFLGERNPVSPKIRSQVKNVPLRCSPGFELKKKPSRLDGTRHVFFINVNEGIPFLESGYDGVIRGRFEGAKDTQFTFLLGFGHDHVVANGETVARSLSFLLRLKQGRAG